MYHLLPSGCPAADTEPPRRPYATFSARSWHDGLKMTKDRYAEENRRFNRLKWLEKHERSADAHKRTITPRFAKFSQVAYYNETPFSLLAPMFRDFQANFQARLIACGLEAKAGVFVWRARRRVEGSSGVGARSYHGFAAERRSVVTLGRAPEAPEALPIMSH